MLSTASDAQNTLLTGESSSADGVGLLRSTLAAESLLDYETTYIGLVLHRLKAR